MNPFIKTISNFNAKEYLKKLNEDTKSKTNKGDTSKKTNELDLSGLEDVNFDEFD